MPCPLCHGDDLTELTARHALCAACGLAHLDPAQRLARDAELAHYRTHENDPADARYRAFLDRLAAPLTQRVAPPACGLDYGSGPGPTLSVMLAERGYDMAIYDPFFAPDPAPLRQRYDFITCTETAEHFHDPAAEFARLGAMLRPGGWLGVMTQLVQPATVDFANWWYARDPTHVVFYQRRTMRWIADRFGWAVEFEGETVTLFHRPTAVSRRP